MDPRLLDYYNRELQFVQEMGAEFAAAYPRIAARLGLEGLECADPYVERLLEGFAFLAARIQLKLDARHPDFTQHLLEMVYPHFLAPVPSCTVVEFSPDLKEGAQLAGLTIPRGASLRTPLGKGDRTACEFRTGHAVTLWPLSVVEAKYLSGTGALAVQGLPVDGRARASIRLRLRAAPGVRIDTLDLDSLTFFLKATPGLTQVLYEQIAADCLGLYLRSAQPGAAVTVRPAASVRQVGFEDEEALLPVTRRGFQGYRLLQEYFAFPERFHFFALDGLRDAVRQCTTDELEIHLALTRAQPALENALDASHFRLFCAPAVNLFPRAADRIHVELFDTEHHLVADRNRPMDFEVFGIERLTAVGSDGESIGEIRPFYAADHHTDPGSPALYYTLQRRPRQLSARQQQFGARAAYVGNECFIAVTDSAQRQLEGRLRQIDAQVLCTNRDLPVQLAVGQGRTTFLIEGGIPVESVRCIAGPSAPRVSPAFGDTAWRLISHLSLNYLSLIEQGGSSSAQMLRDMLALYRDPNDAAAARQVEGVVGVGYRPLVRRMPIPGPITYGRGLEIVLTLDDAPFEGAGIVALASVLERFFSRYVSLNSFTQTRLESAARGTIKTWPVRAGSRQIV
ncbi:MAG TPA: type VI secretion system baseplate subunit TssF [Steroidobacteraceae bacterium]